MSGVLCFVIVVLLLAPPAALGADLQTVPSAAGAYRPDAFTSSRNGKMPEWGICIGNKKGFLPFLERFDWESDSTPSRK